MSPCAGLLPLRSGTVRLAEVDPGRITSLMPGPGQAAALDRALSETHGLGWPAPGQAILSQRGGVVWTGLDQAMLMGPAPDPALARHAALTDQSDAWAVADLSGGDGPEVLARLVPVDLRPQAFAEGATARTLLGHMTASITRTGPETLRIMVFRSMARTLVHDLHAAMDAVAARRGLDAGGPPR
ncbi:sarcosine oxidase subunit gamma [Rhodosalinus halophilus]|uniref:Sarcosine oxidase subunit gamma n=2 Tax=Rhodosalinus halophilus TaxID=2259333 RepID=A0A365U3Y4_9RHOB|nr:sarcosine oxidase subunit gamma [Rhodosalinus halophilus]